MKKLIERSSGAVKDIFTGSEIRYCRAKRFPERSFAARFAAKEAVLKAAGAGILEFDLRGIEIKVLPCGKPKVHLKSKELKHKIREMLGADDFSVDVSFSHEKEMSIAQAVIFPKGKK